MAIYLDETQRNYLKQLLKKNPSNWWAHKKLEEQIQDEENTSTKIASCREHKFAEFIGRKDQCDNCGASNGFSWTRKSLIEKPDQTGKS